MFLFTILFSILTVILTIVYYKNTNVLVIEVSTSNLWDEVVAEVNENKKYRIQKLVKLLMILVVFFCFMIIVMYLQ